MISYRNGHPHIHGLGSILIPLILAGTVGAQEPGDQKTSSIQQDGRSYTVREHGMPPARTGGGFKALLPIDGIAGWQIVGGNALIEREGDILHGNGSSGSNTFLMSDRQYGDFVLDGEVKINPGGNSGWQVRSHLQQPGNPRSSVQGYQLEVDSSERRWSGGFYDERRRGWIHPFTDDPAARAAFDVEEWNHYRIECSGAHVRSWVNGVPCADVIDFADLDGSIAFQVHSGNCDVRWRNLRIHEMGSSSFIDAGPWRPPHAFTPLPDGGLRGRSSVEPVSIRAPLPGPGTTFRMHYRLDGEAIVRISSLASKDEAFTIRLDSRNADRDGSLEGLDAVESKYPVTATHGGTEGAPGDAHELIIDVEGPRVTLLKDGHVLRRVHAGSAVRADIVEITLPPGENSIELLDSTVCVRALPATRN